MIPVNIVIADRTYRLKIKPEDEEAVRSITKLINNKILEFRNAFAGKDMQDYVSMVLLWFATEQNKSGAQMAELQSVSANLTKLKEAIERELTEQ